MLISLFVFACQIEEHVDTDFAERVGLSGNSHDDEQKNTLKHDAATLVPEAKSVLRLRKTAEESDKENKQEGALDSHLSAPRKKGGFPAYIIWLVLSVALMLLVCVGIYGWV